MPKVGLAPTLIFERLSHPGRIAPLMAPISFQCVLVKADWMQLSVSQFSASFVIHITLNDFPLIAANGNNLEGCRCNQDILIWQYYPKLIPDNHFGYPSICL